MVRAAMPNEESVNAVEDAQRKFAAALVSTLSRNV